MCETINASEFWLIALWSHTPTHMYTHLWARTNGEKAVQVCRNRGNHVRHHVSNKLTVNANCCQRSGLSWMFFLLGVLMQQTNKTWDVLWSWKHLEWVPCQCKHRGSGVIWGRPSDRTDSTCCTCNVESRTSNRTTSQLNLCCGKVQTEIKIKN